MRGPGSALERMAPVLLALGALIALGSALALFRGATRPRRVNGFERIERIGTRCLEDTAWERDATRSIEPEPFVPEVELPEMCSVWRAHWVVPRPTLLEIELESDDDGAITLDGTPLVSLPGAHTRATRSAIRDVAPGVHPIEIRWANRAGSGYLRVRMHDRREAYMAGVLPLERDAFFVSREDAQQALEEGIAVRRTPERALGASLLAALAGVLLWLAARGWRRREERPTRRFALIDLAAGGSIALLALWIRSSQVGQTDLAWDELWYWSAGEHQVRNALLGDWSAQAFRFNHEHPPIAKWIYGLGGAMGGIDGARQLGCVLSALSVAFTYGIARVLFDRTAAIGAGLALAAMPHVVAHGRLVGLETIVVFFWTANLLALVIWMKSVRFGASFGDRLVRGDGSAAALGAFVFFPGLLSRLTYLWMAVVVLVGLAWARRREIARGTLPIPVGAILGGLASLLICLALWPWIHTDPVGHLTQTFGHWGGRVPTEYFLGERTVGPPFSYYPVLFVVTTPLLLVLAALIGARVGLRRARWRAGAAIVLVALLAPFLQGLSSFRQDLARYVIQSWPEIALLAGAAVSAAGAWIAARARAGRANHLVRLAPALALGIYASIELRSVEPFPLDYYSELTGGPGGVAERQLFDVSWWAEGGGHAVEWLNEHARQGARVRIDTSNWDVRPRLRDDLVEVQPRSTVPAEYVVTNYHLYGDPPPRGCERIHHVEVRGAPLASVWECDAQ